MITDKERLDWLAIHCYLPNDHPKDGVFVCVGEEVSPLGSFNMFQSNDAKALRDAIDRSIEDEKPLL